MANRWFTQFFGSLEKKPVILSCDFIVDSTNGNGLGLRSLKGPGIANVYMKSSATFTADTHTTATLDNISSTSGLAVGMPVYGSGIPVGAKIASIVSATAITISPAATATASGVTITYAAVGSPDPGTGLIFVQFQDNYYRYLFGTGGCVSPSTGGAINISTGSSLTVGTAYIIASVGTTTTAQWQAVGVPVGVTPAVGVSFIAQATSGTGTGTVVAVGVSGITTFEVIGDPNLSLTSSAATVLGVSSGAYMIIQALGATDSTHTTLIPKAPANGTVIGLSFFLSNSVIKVQGQ